VYRDEFRSVFEHGEILMVVDVLASRLVEINRGIHRWHPEVVTGLVTVGWPDLTIFERIK